MGTWAESGGVLTLSGGGVRTVWIADSPFQKQSAIKARFREPADNTKVVLLSSRDGRWSFEIGVEGANLVIQTVTAGGAPVVVTNGPDDEPVSAACSKAHGLTASTPYRLTVVYAGDVIEVYRDGETTPFLKHTNGHSGPVVFSAHKHWGFVGDVDGAKVYDKQVCDIKGAFEPRGEMLLAICDGVTYYSLDGETFSRMDAGSWAAGSLVSLASFGTSVYGLDGANAKEARLIELDVIDWETTPGRGNIPGFNDTVGDGTGTVIPGTSRMRKVFRFLNRLGTLGDPRDRTNLALCAVDNPHDFKFDALGEPGRAFQTKLSLPGLVPDDLVSAQEATRGALVIGCVSSVRRMIGDPATSTPQIQAVLLQEGVGGGSAMALASDGVLLAVGPTGLLALPAGGEGVNISQDVLTEVLNIPETAIGDHIPIVLRDADRREVNIWLAPFSSSAPAEHVVYDERTGRFAGDRGGYWIDELPAALGPTAAAIFRGEVYIGGRQGLIYRKDDEATSDDGAAIACVFPVEPLFDRKGDRDIVLERVQVILKADSADATITAYAARTPEELYDTENRRTLWTATVSASRPDSVIKRRVRARCILLEVSASSATARLGVEDIKAAWHFVRPLTRRQRTPIEPPAPCRTDSDLTHAPDPGGDPLAGGPGQGDPLGDPILLTWQTSVYDPIVILTTAVVVPDGEASGAMDGGTTVHIFEVEYAAVCTHCAALDAGETLHACITHYEWVVSEYVLQDRYCIYADGHYTTDTNPSN